MEKKYQSLTVFEFENRFKSEDDCYRYLAAIKWKDGFVCKKCGHTHYFEVKNGKAVPHSRQCTHCRHTESPTAGTLFHRMKFSILKAFYIIYMVSTNKKGATSTEMSRKLGLRQKTCWFFKQKVMRAMKSGGLHLLQGKVEVDETVVGGSEEEVRGRKNKDKKLVVLGIERKGKGISRMYGKVIRHADSKELGSFMTDFIDPSAIIKTDEWTAYRPLRKSFPNLFQVPSGKKGSNFPDMHRVIMGFKSWLRGVHHAVHYLQAYLDEYSYRFNRSYMKEGIFDNLLQRMMKNQPCPYKNLSQLYA
jgi:hypothetical protein